MAKRITSEQEEERLFHPKNDDESEKGTKKILHTFELDW